MKPFVAPVEDIVFTLEHVANASRLPDWDSVLAGEIIAYFSQFAEAEIAPMDMEGDLSGCRLENGRVRMPESFVKTYRGYVEQGWPALGASEEYGGQGMPGPVSAAVSEIMSGACHAFSVVCGLASGATRTILAFGTKDQKQRFLPRLASGEWLATMCLTEAGAGSDLSGVRTRAEEIDGVWRITGDKIFISGGDQDMSDGILHLVLARTGDLSEGTRGLSLFLCRSQDEDGARNTISVARVEKKMGIHASPTCQLVFEGARAELLGKPGEGLKAMFTMMNHARLDVGLQGMAHAARAFDISRAYAAERRQGRLPGGDGPVLIESHPDVARMLTEQEALVFGGRAMCYLALVTLEAGDNPDLVDFLTPVCKVFCTDAGIRAADLGIQVLGGYGYLHEYRVEQTLRDARITAIYEGANGIHALALATRMLRNRDGIAAGAFAEWVENQIAGANESDPLTQSFDLWRAARKKVLASSQPAEKAHGFMKLTGLVIYLAVWQIILRGAQQSANPARLQRLAAHVQHSALIEARYWSVL